MTGNKLKMPLIETLKSIIKTEGYLSLFKGLPANVYQAALTSTGFALSYEVVKRFSTNVVGIEEEIQTK
jgi:hypothetical protein